jgi:hypothetical protein
MIAHQPGKGHKQGSPDADQGVGPQSGRVLAELTLQADGDSHQQSVANVEDEEDEFH